MGKYVIRAGGASLLILFAGCRSLDPVPEAEPWKLSQQELRFAKALAHFGQGLLYEEELGADSEQARRHFESASGFDPEAHRLAVKSALVSIRQAQPEKAIESLLASCEANPGSLQCWVDLAVTCQVAGKLDLAEKYYRRALQISPDKTSLYLALASLLFDRDQDAEAIGVLADGVKNVEDPAPLVGRCYAHAQQLIRLKELSRAVACVEFVARHAPSQREQFYHLLGEMHLELGNERQGLRNLRKAARGDTPSVNALRRLARLHLEKDRSRAAIRLLQNASRSMPRNVPILLDLEFVYRQAGRSEDAVTVLDDLSEIFDAPDADHIKHEFYLHYGSICERAGKTERAERVFQKCIDLYPDSHQALNYLAYMWAEAGRNLDKALEYVQRALQHEPQNGAYIDTLGWIYYQKGKYDLALEKIREALDLMQDDPTITDHMGDVLAALGNVDEAIPYWERSFRIDPANEAVAEKLRRHGIDIERLRHDARNTGDEYDENGRP